MTHSSPHSTIDVAASMLCRSVPTSMHSCTLLVVDETGDHTPYIPLLQRGNCEFMTNRFDLYRVFARSCKQVYYSDLSPSLITPGKYDVIAFRVTQGRPLVNHLINTARDSLQPGKALHLAGFKQEGIKTYITCACEQFGSTAEAIETRDGARCVRIVRAMPGPGDQIVSALPTDDYVKLRLIEAGGLTFYSKPGVYGWNKVDEGSRLLIDAIPNLTHKSVVDLGCGYGYLSISAFRLGAASVTATDNNAAAIAACSENFLHFKIPGDVIPSDCGDSLNMKCDVVLSNPPFHQGFKTSKTLSQRFVAAMSRLIKSQGEAFMVCNSFLPYEEVASQYFTDIRRVYNGPRFKVLNFKGPIQAGMLHGINAS